MTTASRAIINGIPKTHGTTILFQHNGLPKTPFYAQKHLKGVLENFGVPSSISGPLANVRCRYSKRIQSALRGAGGYLPLEESHRRFGVELSKKLSEVLPEFGPFDTQFSYLYHEPYIPDAIRGIIDRGTDRLIVVSLYPFEIPYCVEPMRKATSKALNESLNEVIDFKSGKISYAARNKPVSFEFERIDSVGTHPSFAQYWSERLLVNYDKADCIVFAVPMPINLLSRHKFHEMINDVTEHYINRLRVRFSRSVAYRIAFYTSWEYPLPIFPISRTIQSQVKMFSFNGRDWPIILPYGSFFKDFDTESILPSITPREKVLRPDEQDSNLVHSFVELIKHRLLVKQHEAQKVPADPLF